MRDKRLLLHDFVRSQYNDVGLGCISSSSPPFLLLFLV
jgi:hypothetical protein